MNSLYTKAQEPLNVPTKNYWIAVFALTFVSICILLYGDIGVTVRHGINLWNSGLLNYYKSTDGAYYPFPVYVVFAIWDFPIWLVDKIGITHFGGRNPLCWFYAKSMVVAFIYGSAFLIYKICLALKLSESRGKWAALLFLTSASTVVPDLIICQYDGIELFFILLGLLYYVKDDEKKFIAWFSVAVVMKYFALILFIPLLLMREKNVLKIIGKVFMVCLLSIVMYIFQVLTGGKSLVSFIKGFLGNSIAGYSVFILFYGFTCVYLWLKNFDKDERNKYSIWFSMLVFVVFFVAANFGNYYWIVLTVPFICMSIVLNDNKTKNEILIFFETMAQFCLLLNTIKRIWWFFDLNCVSSMGIIPVVQNHMKSLQTVFIKFRLEYLQDIMPSFYFVLMGSLIFLTYPRRESINDNLEHNDFVVPKYIILLRFALLFCFIALLIACCFVSKR